MVAAPHPLAAAAGLETLARGGNAVDAAVAASATLTVTYPHMAGIGGDLFMLVWSAAQGCLLGLNASGPSARLATPDWYRSRGHQVIPARGPLAALTVPGAVAGWATAIERCGRLGLDAALSAAIRHARDGFPTSRSLSAWLSRRRRLLAADAGLRAMFLPGGCTPSEGERLRLPNLADSLEEVARQGPGAFYGGGLGERIVRALQGAGSPLRGDDFAAYQPRWVEPIDVVYRDRRVCTLPPNSQGMTLLQILNVIEGFDLQSLGHLSAEYIHLIVGATRLAFEDRDRFVVDPDFTPAPLGRLLSKPYAATMRERLGSEGSSGGSAGGDTVYLCTADDEGNAVSLIQSIYHDFGSGFAAGDTGVIVQNRGSAFPIEQGHPGRLEPGKRPFHTLMPVMALEGGLPAYAFGAMGGDGQPQTGIALATRLLDFDDDVQAAVEAPRWLFGRTWGEPVAGLTVERDFPEETLARLARLGHQLRLAPSWSDVLGHAQAIRIDRGQGVFWGGADPRGDGAALGR